MQKQLPTTFKPYAAIGSRKAPEDMLLLQHHMGRVMCDLGWHGFSGWAEGPDETYCLGAQQSRRYDEIGFTNIIPWNGFTGGSPESLQKHYHNPSKGTYNYQFSEFKQRAMWLGLGARGGDHGLFKGVKRGERAKRLVKLSGGVALHSRNAMQILGLVLRYKVPLVHCWAPPRGTKGHVSGGTATAVALALHYKIPVVNMATKDGLRRTLDLLKTHGVEIDYDHYEKVLEGYAF